MRRCWAGRGEGVALGDVSPGVGHEKMLTRRVGVGQYCLGEGEGIEGLGKELMGHHILINYVVNQYVKQIMSSFLLDLICMDSLQL